MYLIIYMIYKEYRKCIIYYQKIQIYLYQRCFTYLKKRVKINSPMKEKILKLISCIYKICFQFYYYYSLELKQHG